MIASALASSTSSSRVSTNLSHLKLKPNPHLDSASSLSLTNFINRFVQKPLDSALFDDANLLTMASALASSTSSSRVSTNLSHLKLKPKPHLDSASSLSLTNFISRFVQKPLDSALLDDANLLIIASA